MGVLTDLIVAPRSDIGALGATPSNERPWLWVDVKGLGPEELATIHCLVDGVDADEPLSPPEWAINPFTKQKIALTVITKYLDEFQCEADDTEVIVQCTPPRLVAHLAGLDAAGIAELAQRWERESAEEYLESICAMARAATERGHDLFVFCCP